MKTDKLALQITDLIAEVVTRLETDKVLVISPENVANEVDQAIDPDKVSPILKTYASTLQIRQLTRAYLRKRHDPVGKMEDELKHGIGDLFSDQLQPYYPVHRDNEMGYAPVESLTDDEIDFNALRMRQAGRKLLSHADALVAYKNERAVMKMNAPP